MLPLAEGAAYRSADVRVEDPRFADRLCSLLGDGKHDGLQGVPISAPMPQTTDYRRVDSKKVYCSWHKPTRTAWLNFGNGDIAAKVGSNFSSGAYKVLGHNVQSEEPKRAPEVGSSWRGRQNPVAWTVKLTGVPGAAGEHDVKKNIRGGLSPRHVELSPSTYTADLAVANTMIESILRQAGPLESWEASLDTTGKRYKAKARFVTDADARQAVKSLNNKTLPFNEHGKLTVQLVHTARLKISTRVYDAAENEIAVYKHTWEAQHLVFVAYSAAQGLRVLKLEGGVASDVAQAKATLERILDGELVQKDDGDALWAPSFSVNGHAYQKMKQMERDLGIVIVRDKRRYRLHLLGPKLRREEAHAALVELAQADSSSEFVMELDAKQLSRACKGGLQAITAAIGAGKVKLDVVSHPRRMIVVGSEADLRLAHGILQGRGGQATRPNEEVTGSVEDCAICWTEPEDPVRTPCNHVYCSGCFEDLCSNGVKSGPSITCQGDAGRCGRVIPLSELELHLPSAVLEDMLETAFATHVSRHLDELRHCPTPDCGQMYRAAPKPPPAGDDKKADVSTSNPLFTCPVCFTGVCTACHVAHDGLTCAEHRDNASGGYEALAQAKEKYGIKDCPKCGTPIQKSFGCNHMTCSTCQTHICWVCMETFAERDPVYAHMQNAHGGIGVE